MATPKPVRRSFLDNKGTPTFTTIGLPSAFWRDVYHRILLMQWRWFFFNAVLAYSGMHIVFAALFTLEPGSIGNSDGSYMSAYFFSVQTMMTIGYGGMSPATTWANVIVTIEAFIGLLFTAMLTGLVFAKFTKPSAAVLWSKVATIAMHDGKPTLAIRMANARGNRIVEASVSMTAAVTGKTKEGELFRKLHDLHLVRRSSPIFSVSFTAMHVIDASSPLYGETPESLREKALEIISILTGLDETSGQTVHARTSYAADDLRFGHRFADVIRIEDDGNRVIDYTLFHDTKPAPLPAEPSASVAPAPERPSA
jgi:inward rectifier potassium channel